MVSNRVGGGAGTVHHLECPLLRVKSRTKQQAVEVAGIAGHALQQRRYSGSTCHDTIEMHVMGRARAVPATSQSRCSKPWTVLMQSLRQPIVHRLELTVLSAAMFLLPRGKPKASSICSNLRPPSVSIALHVR